ncbi:MAG: RNA-binding protein [Rhodospirillales bacterium]|nr:RNA-binding protein [Rhodospirillales bacterium]
MEPADASDDDTGPSRRCLATGRVRPKDELIRFVVGPEGALVPDLAERLPGRGLWLSPGPDMVNTALSKGLFAKAARHAIVAAPDLAERVESLLVRRCQDLLGLARRAGQAVAGFEKVRGFLSQGPAALLLEARDGAEDGWRKIAAKAGDRVPIVLLSRAELGWAMGRDQAVHVAVAPGGLATRLERELSRLAEWRRADRTEGAGQTARGKSGRSAPGKK